MGYGYEISAQLQSHLFQINNIIVRKHTNQNNRMHLYNDSVVQPSVVKKDSCQFSLFGECAVKLI